MWKRPAWGPAFEHLFETELLGRRDDHAAQLDERDATNVDGAAAREQQHAQRLLAPSRAWQGQRLGRDSCTRRADRVEWIVFAAQPPLDAGVPADFEDRFTLTSLAPPSGPRQLP